MAIEVFIGEGSVTVGEKNFKTGSRGFFGTGKVEIDGRRYQAQVQLVEIGSKPVTPEMLVQKAEAKEARAAAALDKAREARLEMVKALKA